MARSPAGGLAPGAGRSARAAALLRPRERRSLGRLVAVAVALGALAGRFLFAGGEGSGPSLPPAPAAGRSSEQQVAALQAALTARPDDPAALTRLAVAYLARVRDTADPSYFRKARQAVERSLALDPQSAAAMTAAGLVALGSHDFSAALDWGRRAHAAAPDTADPLGVVVDAYVELGRYPEGAAAAQDMVDRRPSLAGLARVSYLRELHGDRPGAIAAMTQAVTAGAGNAADVAVVLVLLGDLRLGTGDLAAARDAYDRALERVPALAGAEVGLARAAAAGGDLTGAIARLEPVVSRRPEASSVALLGDLYAATGRGGDAEAQYELVRHIEELNRAGGVAVELELARFEADHARPEAVGLAEAARAARPTIYADDALAWALRQSGRPEEALPHARSALRLGTADALLWYHLAAVEADLGMVDQARSDLARAFALNPYLTVRDRPAAQLLAESLGVARP